MEKELYQTMLRRILVVRIYVLDVFRLLQCLECLLASVTFASWLVRHFKVKCVMRENRCFHVHTYLSNSIFTSRSHAKSGVIGHIVLVLTRRAYVSRIITASVFSVWSRVSHAHQIPPPSIQPLRESKKHVPSEILSLLTAWPSRPSRLPTLPCQTARISEHSAADKRLSPHRPSLGPRLPASERASVVCYCP